MAVLPRGRGNPGAPSFNPDLSLAIDRLILAIEAARPSARRPLRVLKRCLEAGIPVKAVQR